MLAGRAFRRPICLFWVLLFPVIFLVVMRVIDIYDTDEESGPKNIKC